MAEDTRSLTELMDKDPRFRSRDEVQNLWLALVDCIWRVKWGITIKEGDDMDPAKLEEVKPLLQELIVVWGSKAEAEGIDARSEENVQRATVESGYGVNSKRPFVELNVDGQYRPEAARQIALQILDVATVAEDDALIMRWVQEALPDADEMVAASMMNDLRKFRHSSREADMRMDGAEQLPDVAEVRRGVRAIRR